ncbi:SOS response-associated peptidase [Chitinimonas sp. BJYL2]|uniref:SOS response-associated peptidase n=1 Tax=Chitinimonas sp. BJYL2 TaxID=2976696 RepID=UPI0022B46A22|nr:SOS response-associated peptidase family protein [Chitinimonas sp. BJYL2]
MCTSYTPPALAALQARFGVEVGHLPGYPAQSYRDYAAPIIRKLPDGTLTADMASFGFTPQRHIPDGVKPWDSMNARAETIATKPTFARAWKSCQLCLIPMNSLWEPFYGSNDVLWANGMGEGRPVDAKEIGKSVRHRICTADGQPFAVAGLWREWQEADGSTSLSFTMITINADSHAIFRQMHKPDSPPDKRSVVIIPQGEWHDWLDCKNPEIARTFLKLYPADLMQHAPDPLPPRIKKPKHDPFDDMPDLFG